MKYIAILRQTEGCDYTIGCGMNTIQLEAENATEAGLRLQEIVRENYSSDERRLDSISFYEIAGSYEVDVNVWYAKLDQMILVKEQEEKIQRELVELERLKKKYNQ